MLAPIEVTDPSDPRLADYIDLRDRDLRRLARSVCIAEGVGVVRVLLESPLTVRSVLVTPERLAALQGDLRASTSDFPVYVAPRDLLRRVVGFDLHRGAVAAADRPQPPPLERLLTASRIAVLEGLNDHENLGSLFRSAAALGVGAVLLSPRCADPLYRRTIRVSMGHVLRVPFGWADPWDATLAAVRAAGYTVAALTPGNSAIDIREAGLARIERVAFLLGAEGPGLTADAMEAADLQIRIAMSGGVDSLNVATAAAVAFFAGQPWGEETP